jgi:hypothetical protein
MISTGQILAAGAITGVAVAVAAAAVRWRPPWLAAAAISAFALILLWRWISNVVGLNGDFGPLVSIGDVGCLAAGALGPAAVAATGRPGESWSWVPAVAGGVAGILVNVVIL